MIIRILIMTLAALGASNTAQAQSPVVLELFTSQSCSSCPPADALMKNLSQSDPSILPLSFHVDYWDHLNWKDTFSSPANTQRQRNYSQSLGINGIYTPQMIIGGNISALGSNQSEVNNAISKTRQLSPELNISIKPVNNKLTVNISAQKQQSANIDILEIRFNRYAKTQVQAGENGGRVLESVNNVTSIKQLGILKPEMKTLPLKIEPVTNDSVAIIAQIPGQGRILGAASYIDK